MHLCYTNNICTCSNALILCTYKPSCMRMEVACLVCMGTEHMKVCMEYTYGYVCMLLLICNTSTTTAYSRQPPVNRVEHENHTITRQILKPCNILELEYRNSHGTCVSHSCGYIMLHTRITSVCNIHKFQYCCFNMQPIYTQILHLKPACCRHFITSRGMAHVQLTC